MRTTARKQVIKAAHEHGWVTSRGFSDDPDSTDSGWAGARDGARVALEFSSRGAITWAWHNPPGDRQGNRIPAPDRLSRVLEILKAEQPA